MKKRGFTIVELVIVIAVIAILAAVLIPTFTTVVRNAHVSKATSEARNTVMAYTAEYKRQYPDSEPREGIVYVSGDYAFTNTKEGIQMIDEVGTCTISDETVRMYLLGDLCVLGSRKSAMLYELRTGTYKVYSLKNADGAGRTYYMWVYQATENNYQQVKDIGDADIYLAAMISTDAASEQIIAKYNIKTKKNDLDGDMELSTIWIDADLGSYTIDIDESVVTIQKTGMKHISLNGYDYYNSETSVDTYSITHNDIAAHYKENGAGTDNGLALE